MSVSGPDFGKAELIPVIAQDEESGDVLMLAYMNEEAYRETLQTRRVCYYSRSRQKLWRKGEESGNVQLLKEVRLDCDADTVLLKVEQVGGIACHTGRRSCFYTREESGEWIVTDAVVKDPQEMYGKSDD